MGEILAQRFEYSARLFVHSQKVIPAKACSCLPKSRSGRHFCSTLLQEQSESPMIFFFLYHGKNT